MKRKSLPSLVKKAVTVFNKYVRLKYTDRHTGLCKCVTCDKTKNFCDIQAGHYIKSTYFHTRFDETNVHPQCIYCNKYLSGNESSYALFLVRTYGCGILEILNEKKNRPVPSSAEVRSACEEVIEKYSNIIKQVTQGENN